MEHDTEEEWKKLAELAAAERDPEKLHAIIGELTASLTEHENKLRGKKFSKRLLFVDDEENIRRTLPLILMDRGFEVHVAASVTEALALIETNKFDVLISDLNIGEQGDGFLVVRAMRKAQPQCVTILLTGYPTFESAVEAIHHEVDDYVVKPADIDALVTVIDRNLLTLRSRRTQV